MAPPLGAVEVRRANRWCSGYAVDIREDALLIRYESEAPEQEVSLEHIRKVPKRVEEPDPVAGDHVELWVAASDHLPSGWTVVSVKEVRAGFIFVRTEDGAEAIVEKSKLRPVSPHQAAMSAAKDIFKLPSTLHSWILTSDASGCLSHIEEQSNAVLIKDPRDPSEVHLVGDEKSRVTARMLLELHVKHQAQIQKFSDVRDNRLKALESRRNRLEGGSKHSLEVKIKPDFVKRIIGRGGEAIKALEEKFDVKVNIMYQEGPERVVRLYGNNMEMLEKARAEVEFVEESIPVDDRMHDWVLGYRGKNVRDIQLSAGLLSAKLERKTNELVLCGTRDNVSDAIAMFETQMMYHDVFDQAKEEMDQIIEQLQEYGDYNARYDWKGYDWSSWNEEPQGKGKSSWKDGKGKGGKGKGKMEDAVKGKWEQATKGKAEDSGKGKQEDYSLREKGGKKGKRPDDTRDVDKKGWRRKELDSEEPAKGKSRGKGKHTS